MNTQFTMALAPASALQSSTQSLPPPLPITKEEINALHNKFLEYGRSAKHWIRQCQLMLPKIRDEEVWAKKGFPSIYEYAAKLAGMSHNSVNEALRVHDALLDKPILRDEIEKHGTHKVKTIITVATENTQEFWVKRLNEMSKSTLETYVREYKSTFKNGLPGEGQRTASQDGDMSNGIGAMDGGNGKAGVAGYDTSCNRQMASIYMKLEVEVIEKLKRMKGDRDWNELMKDLLGGCAEERIGAEDHVEASTAVSKSADGGAEQKPAPVNTGKRYVPRKIQKYVTRKTSGLCAYPGCTKPYEILHHTKRFAIDATHDPDTLKPLCKAHERLAHGGLIESEEKCPVNWSLLAEADTNSLKYEVDKKVNEYYMPKLE